MLDDRVLWLSRLAACVVHEVGNPLQSIHSCLDLSLEDVALSPASREYLELAHEELARIAELLVRLRELYQTNTPEWADVNLETFANVADPRRR
jgi:nitrogen-specific signal transduction histidine kinase